VLLPGNWFEKNEFNTTNTTNTKQTQNLKKKLLYNKKCLLIMMKWMVKTRMKLYDKILH
jgi:hypothetical protein